ncbi:MAG: hypothetical protein Q8M15_04855 [Bacteroidota bacterium]|nr:hypothetical protein [Bacteroidota bacterium]
METLPLSLTVLFILTIIITVAIFYKACNQSKVFLIFIIGWLVIQSLISLSGFYTVTDNLPPRFVLVPIPLFICILLLFFTQPGQKFLDSLNIKILTLIHVIRIPVELCLFWLFTYKTIPQLMTFEGRNFDIISGISAPFIYYFGFVKPSISRNIILLWNFICLGLLLNIVIHAALSAPFPLQQFAFDQPNIAVLYFPFVFLPGCIVPLILLSHLASIRQLLKKETLQ